MDTPASGQSIEFYIEDSTTPGVPFVALGYVFTSGNLHAYVSVTDIDGNGTAVDQIVATDGLEHTLEVEFTGVGNTYNFYIDGVLIGSQAPPQPSVSAFDYLQLAMQTNNASNVVYASQVEINNCP